MHINHTQTVGCFYVPPGLTGLQNSTFCPHSVFMQLVCLLQDRVCSLHNMN